MHELCIYTDDIVVSIIIIIVNSLYWDEHFLSQ